MRSWLAADPPLDDDAIPFGGTDWNQAAVARAVDGDTVRLHRRRVTAEQVSSDDVGALVCSDWRVRVVEDDVLELPGGIAARLVNLDTPERGQPGYREATADLLEWCADHAGEVRCVTYDTGGGFDRLLVDLYVLADLYEGQRSSASEFMLRRGWAPYVEGA